MSHTTRVAALHSVVAIALLVVASTVVPAVSGEARQAPQPPVSTAAPPAPPSEKVLRKWTMEELLPAVTDLGTGHDWARGREVFKKAACGGCHAFASESQGSGLAPDLTGVSSKYTRDFILQSILEPSATLNGQYFHTTFTLKDGKVITGTVIDVVDKKVIVAPVMLNPNATIEIAEADVKSEAPASISPMPAGLLDEFSREQIIELMAFLDSGGDRNAAVYKKH
jgi:putative heme-binding domain-containing protein